VGKDKVVQEVKESGYSFLAQDVVSLVLEVYVEFTASFDSWRGSEQQPQVNEEPVI
jgi:hypothetical protein